MKRLIIHRCGKQLLHFAAQSVALDGMERTENEEMNSKSSCIFMTYNQTSIPSIDDIFIGILRSSDVSIQCPIQDFWGKNRISADR